jgi:hypothetical protein
MGFPERVVAVVPTSTTRIAIQLPPKLYESIVGKFSELRRQGQSAHALRDE